MMHGTTNIKNKAKSPINTSLSHGVTPSTILSLVKECRCLNEREVTARSFLLPPAAPITARWADGDLMSKLSPPSWARTVHDHGQPQGCPFGLTERSPRLATLKSVQVHLCTRYVLHIKSCTLHSTKRNKTEVTPKVACTDETSVYLQDENS